MKKVLMMHNFTIFYNGVVEVPDHFEFQSDNHRKRSHELEKVVERSLDSYCEVTDIDFNCWIGFHDEWDQDYSLD